MKVIRQIAVSIGWSVLHFVERRDDVRAGSWTNFTNNIPGNQTNAIVIDSGPRINLGDSTASASRLDWPGVVLVPHRIACIACMARQQHSTAQCQICKAEKPHRELVPAEFVRPALLHLIESQHPQWQSNGFICIADLNQYRMAYVRQVLETEGGEISALEKEVLESLRDNELVSANLYADFDAKLTRGELFADRLAMFGGSWKFIILFGLVLLVWIGVNSVALLGRPFDPYPFILLNLVLSCLAALQAPIIIMSQNRMEARDRLRAENDYKINLKAELEIRHLHEKLDHLLKQQWTRLIEIQEIQLELMEELAERKKH